MTLSLTESVEDYLMEIFLLSQQKKVVRLKDIAKRRKVKMPAVVNAIQNLKGKGLVEHEKYGYIELTEGGLKLAKKLYERHKTIYSFFHEILGVSESIAESDTHKVEHDLHVETLNKIISFMEFVRRSENDKHAKWFKCFAYFSQNNEMPDDCEILDMKGESVMKKERKLGNLKKGERGRILRIISNDSDISIKSRLMSMGMVPGTEIKVEKVAPLGDPIDVLVKGYHLSLRKEEANQVIVEEL